MEQNEFFEINGFIVKIPKDKYEVIDSYLDRVSFIISKLNSYNYIKIKKKLPSHNIQRTKPQKSDILIPTVSKIYD